MPTAVPYTKSDRRTKTRAKTLEDAAVEAAMNKMFSGNVCKCCRAVISKDKAGAEEKNDNRITHLHFESGNACSNAYSKELFLACKKKGIPCMSMNSKDPMMEAILVECDACEDGAIDTCTIFNIGCCTSNCKKCDGRGFTIVLKKKTHPKQNGNHSISGSVTESDYSDLRAAVDKLPTDSVGPSTTKTEESIPTGSTSVSTTTSASSSDSSQTMSISTATNGSEVQYLMLDDKPISVPSLSPNPTNVTTQFPSNIDPLFLDEKSASYEVPNPQEIHEVPNPQEIRRLAETNHSMHSSSSIPVLITGFVLLGFMLKKVFCPSRQTQIPIHDEE